MGRTTLDQLSSELQANAQLTVTRANDLLAHFGSYRSCTSGYRSKADQMRINPSAIHSNHLTCSAVDLEDEDGKLNKFCKDNQNLLETIGLWCEERQGNWQHIQIVPPKSGHRFFFP